jgi:ankyrin
MWAVAERHPEVVRLLLAAHADVAARSRLTRLRVNRADPNDIYTGVVGDVSRGSSTALLFAARSGDAESARLLLQAGANANDAAPDGNTALVIAAHSNQTAVAEVLLEHGANPNAVGGGYSALHAAVLRGSLSLVNSLLARGARIDSQVRNGTTTTRATLDYYIPENFVGATPLLLAAHYLEIDIMRALASKGADARIATKDGTTVLMAAAGVPAPPQARQFDRRGRPAPIRNSDEARALDTVTLAVELGGADVNAANSAGDTALHGAAAQNDAAAARFLIDRGARVDVRNRAGRTPLAVAAGEEVSAVLKKAGADK